MAKHKKKIIIAASVLICALLLVVLCFVLKKRVFPAINDYQWSYEQEFIDEHDSDMVIDGKLDEARWSGQKWLTHSDNGVALKYTTVFTDYGLYIGAEVEDDDLQWNKRFNFAKYTADCSNSAFHFRISHSDATTATTFNRYNFYVDTQDSASRNQTHHEAKATLNGELNPKNEKNKANKMTAELFVSWEALHLEDGKPDDIRIFPEYRYVKGESSADNTWVKPICYEEGSTRMFLSALFGEEGYINADKENALLGDSKTGMSKSDGWDVSRANKGEVSVNDYYQQNIFYKGIYSDAYIYSTTMKITGEREKEVGYAGVCDTKDGRNLNAFYIDARGVLKGSETLTLHMMDYARWTTHTIGTIPNKASYKTEGIPLTVIKDDTHMYYLVDGNLVHCEEVSFIEGKSSPGLFSLRASAEYDNCKVTDYADKKDELKEIISKYVYSVEIEGKISGGSVSTDVIALPRNGKVSGKDLNLTIMADNGYILSELTIDGTNSKSNDYLAYAAKNMKYGSLVIPKESIVGDVSISAKFTSMTKVFDKDAVVISSGAVTNAVEAKQSAKIVIHNQECVSPLLSSITQSGVTGAFDVYLLKKGTYTIGNGVTVQSDGKYVLGASNGGYVTEYVNVTADNKEPISIVLTKNKVTSGYAETGDGGYKSTQPYKHNYFIDGTVKEWLAKMTLPAMKEDLQVGFVLHKADPSMTWSQWMRIAPVIKEGKVKVLTHMNVDNAVFAQKYYDTGLDAAQAEGKVFQLVLVQGKLNCYLNDKLIFVFTDFTMINDYTVSQVLSLNGKVACGLYSNQANVVLKQFSFVTEKIPQGEVLYKVSGTVTADTDAMRRFQMVVTDTKNGNIYVTKVDRDGNYSIDLPKGQYRFTFKHSSQEKFFYPIPIEKNIVSISQNTDNINFTAKPITTSIGTFHCKLNIPLIDVEPDAFKLRLKHDTYGEFTVYRNLDGSFTTNAPVGNYKLSVKHKTESLFTENVFQVNVKKGDNNKTVTLKKNAITNGSYTLTEDLYYQSNGPHRHNMFEKAYGKVWEANLEMPALNENERVGFVVHKYEDNAVVWGNWFRLFVGKTKDGKLEVVSQICADKTKDTAEINVSANRKTDIDADAVVGKKLQVVHKNGVLSLRLDGQIINLYTNETYLASRGKSTQVKNVLDLNGELTCGLLTNTKGIVIKDWAFTNVKKNVPNNPALNGTLRGKVELSIDTLKLDQVRILLKSKDGQMSFHTYAKADGTYEIKAPVGEYLLEVSNDGTATYTHNTYEVIVRKTGTTQNVVLNSKNAINNSSFTLNKDGYYESTKAYGHNTFVYGHGKAWEASLEMPELNGEEQVGFILHRYKDNATVWGNWLRLLVGKNKDGKIELAAQICADATKDTAEINVSTSRPTDIDADDAVGKTLQAVYKDGVLSVRLDGQIINLYTNETYMASRGKSTQVKKVLDLNGELACGLLTNTKGIVIKDWAFTNIEKNVPDNPVLNGTLKGKVELSINTLGLDQVRILLKSKDGKMSFHTYADENGNYEIQAPVGEYRLEVSNDGVAAYTPYEQDVTITKWGTTKNIVLNAKNAINNNAFTLTKEGYFESTQRYGHNSFVNGYGDAWEANLEMPELNENEQVGFVIVKYEKNAYVWGNWLRLLVEKSTDGKLQLVAQICADKTEERPEINVTSSRTTDINADDVIGKKLQAVYKDGILTLRLDGQILNLYTNETYLASKGKSTQVKDVFDLTKELSCGLLTNTKGMIIKDWAFTNIDENVANNPKLNGTLSGQVTLSVNTMKHDQVRLTLHSKDGKTNFHTYASADGTYEMNAPVGEYQLVVSNDGKATYTPYEYDVTVTKDGTIQNIALNSKNAVQNTTFVLTEEGYYQRSTNGYEHNIFVNGYGTEWSAEMTMPKLNENEAAGFVLLKRGANGEPVWGNWMRIYVLKNADGTLQLRAHMNVDKQFNTARRFQMSGTSVENKKFQIMLLDGRLVISLDNKVLYNFTSNTELVAGKGTVGEVLGFTEEAGVYCGLLVNKAGTVVKDWAFTNMQENLPSIPNYNAMLKGEVKLSLNTLPVEQIRLELSNASGTYSTYAFLDGTYEIFAPAGKYQLKVTNDGSPAYTPYEQDMIVEKGENVKNVVLDKKNAIHNDSFTLTQEGYYKSKAGDRHNYFEKGYGTVWFAEMEIPSLEAGKGAGFVLHKRNADSSVPWEDWMRIYLKKTTAGNMELVSNIKNSSYKAITLAEQDVTGKTFKVSLLNNRIVVMLEDEVLAIYDSGTEIETGKGTVGDALGLSENNGVYCGLFGSGADIVIKDWNYTNKLDMSKKYTASGNVSVGLADAKVTDVTLTFVNKADTAKTCTVKPDEEGKYSVQLPTADYKVTVSHTNYVDNVFECRVMMDDVTNDICLRRNKVHNDAFALTKDGFYQSSKAYGHNYFMNGYGNMWIANLEMPELTEGQGVGFILHKRTNGGITWGNWMRILLGKTDNGAVQLHTQMHVDGKFDIGKTVELTNTAIAGKTMQVALLNGKLFVMLDGNVLAEYESSTKIQNGNETVGDVFGDLSDVYCGLLAKQAGIVVKDWNFVNIIDEAKEYKVSGTVSLGLAGAKATEVTLNFVNKTDATKTYTVVPNEDAMYSVTLPSADYEVTVSHANYLDNVFECKVIYSDVKRDLSLRKNKINNSVFVETEDGSYKSANGNNTIFKSGNGNAWVSEIEIPSMENGQGIGFVLHKGTNSGITWGNWMRIMLVKADNGDIQLYARMSVDGNTNLQAEKTVALMNKSVEGKILQLSLLNGKLVLALAGEEIAAYESDTKLVDNKGTVGEVLGAMGTDGTYCGLLANKKDIVVSDWNFTNIIGTSEEYTVSGSVSAEVANVNVSDATITFVNEADSSKSYSAVIDGIIKLFEGLPKFLRV